MPLLWLSFAFILGILFSSYWLLPIGWWLALSLVAALLLVLPRLFRLGIVHTPGAIRFLLNRLPLGFSQRVTRALLGPVPAGKLAPRVIAALIFLGTALGGMRFITAQPEFDEGQIAWYNDDQSVQRLVGVVVEPPDIRDNNIQLTIQAERIELGGLRQQVKVEGLVLVRVPSEGEWDYGDRLILDGELHTPPEDEDFSYRAYLVRQGIYSYMPFAYPSLLGTGEGKPVLAAIYTIKQRGLDLVYRYVPDPEASLMAGILLGVESGIDEDVEKAFRDTGTTHVIAISGFNITIVAGLFASMFGRWLGRVKGAVAAVAAIAVYTILVGADAAVVRAAIMGGLALFARQVGRQQHGLNSLAVTAAVMALFNPLTIWDVGFQLSFAATLGLVLYAERFSQAFERLALRKFPQDVVNRLVGPVGEYVLFTLAAQLTTFPILVYHFQRFSLNSFPANMAILPAQPAIMIVGGAAVLLGLLWVPLGQGLAYITWPFAAYTIRVVEWFAQFRGGVIVFGEVGWVFLIAYYLVILGITIWGGKIRSRVPTLRPAVIVSGLLIVTSLTWQAALASPDGNLHVTILDVGSGDAVLIQTPAGRYVLVDGGPSASRLSDALGRRLPLFHRQLDVLIVAGGKENQVSALPRVVERFPPTEVLWAGPRNASYEARYLDETLNELGIPVRQAEAGQALDLGDDARLEILTIGDQGAVLLLSWDNFRMVIPSGADFDSIQVLEMGKEIGPVTALLLADSGYAPINPPEWIVNLHPQAAVVSVAAGDFSGLPSAETMEALEGYSLFRTDHHGWIQISTDGFSFWVNVARP